MSKSEALGQSFYVYSTTTTSQFPVPNWHIFHRPTPMTIFHLYMYSTVTSMKKRRNSATCQIYPFVKETLSGVGSPTLTSDI